VEQITWTKVGAQGETCRGTGGFGIQEINKR
jgi:hypothetical protein